MTIIQKIVKAGELPAEWAKEFADPNMRVSVRLDEPAADLAAGPPEAAPPQRRRISTIGPLSPEDIEALQRDDIPPESAAFNHEISEEMKQMWAR